MDDKISGMSDDVLVKILTLLPTKLALSTSILSKRWKFLWMWCPKLNYVSKFSKNHVLRGFIDKNLPLHRAPVIEKLSLYLSFILSNDSYIKPKDIKLWVEIAVSRHVPELEIDYYSAYESIFPSSLFTCNSLVTPKLRGMILTDVPSMACLPCLKTLQLKSVRFVDQGLLQELLSICPVLEDLSVCFYELYEIDMKKFTIIVVPSLLSLSLAILNGWFVDGYEIDTPSLEFLKLQDWNYLDRYSLITNMPKLKEAFINVESSHLLKSVIGSITSVERLTICSKGVNGDDFVFNQLEHLKLCVCRKDSSNLLGQLLKDSPYLQVLEISVLEDHGRDERNGMVCWNQPSYVPECLLSSLQIFKWSRYFGRPQDRDIAVYILKNALHLKTATFLADTKEHFVPNIKMIKELALSSRASSSCELVFVED